MPIYFLLRHLKILVEQIKPFDITLMTNDTYLDFSHLLVALRNVASKNLFLWNKDNAIYQGITQASPRIKTSCIDYKQEMEALLRTTSQQFIKDVENTLLKDISCFLSLVVQFQSAQRGLESSLQKKKSKTKLP